MVTPFGYGVGSKCSFFLGAAIFLCKSYLKKDLPPCYNGFS